MTPDDAVADLRRDLSRKNSKGSCRVDVSRVSLGCVLGELERLRGTNPKGDDMTGKTRGEILALPDESPTSERRPVVLRVYQSGSGVEWFVADENSDLWLWDGRLIPVGDMIGLKGYYDSRQSATAALREWEGKQRSATNDAGTQTATDLGLQPPPPAPAVTIDELTAIVREACREWSRNQSWGEPGMYAAVAKAIADKLAYHRTATERQLNSDLSAANREVERLKGELEAWEETARQHCRNEAYYRGLVVSIGEGFGKPAYTSDDGSEQQDVLCAKVPELVATARRELAECREELAESRRAHDATLELLVESKREVERLHAQLAEAQAGAAACDYARRAALRAMNFALGECDGKHWREHSDEVIEAVRANEAFVPSTALRALTEAHAAEVGELRAEIERLNANLKNEQRAHVAKENETRAECDAAVDQRDAAVERLKGFVAAYADTKATDVETNEMVADELGKTREFLSTLTQPSGGTPSGSVTATVLTDAFRKAADMEAETPITAGVDEATALKSRIATLLAAGNGLAKFIRTLPVATWPVKELDAWTAAAGEGDRG